MKVQHVTIVCKSKNLILANEFKAIMHDSIFEKKTKKQNVIGESKIKIKKTTKEACEEAYLINIPTF